MFKKTSRNALSGFKTRYFRPDKARTASFLNGLTNKLLNRLIHEEILKTVF